MENKKIKHISFYSGLIETLERQLSVEVEGTGELAGLENGSLTDITPYRVPGRSTFRGRLLAFVRRREPGKIYVRISAEDCNTTVALGG